MKEFLVPCIEFNLNRHTDYLKTVDFLTVLTVCTLKIGVIVKTFGLYLNVIGLTAALIKMF